MQLIRFLSASKLLMKRYWGASRLPAVQFTAASFSSSEEKHRLFKKQMEELIEEREALFGFTVEEHDAWSNAGNNHKHDAAFMENIEQARQGAAVEDGTQDEDDTVEKQDSAKKLTHLSEDKTSVQMVDVGAKPATQRRAIARSKVIFPPEVIKAFGDRRGTDLVGPKGPIFATAKLAGIMAAKLSSKVLLRSHRVIPMTDTTKPSLVQFLQENK